MAKLPSVRTESPLTSFRNMIDDFFREPFFRMADRDITGRVWPQIDVTDEKESFVIRADLPGMERKDIQVSTEGDVLTISGEKKEEYKSEEGAYAHLERSYGSFSRSFTLPEYVDKEKIDAKYKNGVLELILKKTGKSVKMAKQIEIKE